MHHRSSSVSTFLLFGFLLGAIPNSLSAQEHCNALLSEGLKNIRRHTTLDEWNNYLFHNACRKTESGWSFDLGLAKFDLGIGSKEGENFCETQQKSSQGRIGGATYTSILTSEALTAWNTCQALAKQNVKMETEIGLRHVDVRVQRTSGAPLMLQTVHFDQGISQCSVSHTKKTKPVASSQSINLALSDDRVSTIHCERKASNIDEAEYFFPAELSVVTDRGSLLLQLPEEERYSPSLASELNGRIDSLHQEAASATQALRHELDSSLRTPDTECRWTDWVNAYDGEMTARCQETEMLVGLHSVHSSKKEDRMFKFRCCPVR